MLVPYTIHEGELFTHGWILDFLRISDLKQKDTFDSLHPLFYTFENIFFF